MSYTKTLSSGHVLYKVKQQAQWEYFWEKIFTEEILDGKLHFMFSANFKVGRSPSKKVVLLASMKAL